MPVRIVFEIGNCRLLNADFFRQLALRPAVLLANQFHCIRQLHWAIDLLKAHHVIRPQQIYPLKGILSVLSFSEDKVNLETHPIRSTG